MFREETTTATKIGMASMGCLDSAGIQQCPKMCKGCTPSQAMACMGKAFVDYPETRAEILVAGLTMISRTAKTLDEIRRTIPGIEMAVHLAA